jgi:DNA-binding IclR family transcriptional regulator
MILLSKDKVQTLLNFVEGYDKPYSPSFPEIADAIGCTKVSVHKTIHELINLGYVSVAYTPQGRISSRTIQVLNPVYEQDGE